MANLGDTLANFTQSLISTALTMTSTMQNEGLENTLIPSLNSSMNRLYESCPLNDANQTYCERAGNQTFQLPGPSNQTFQQPCPSNQTFQQSGPNNQTFHQPGPSNQTFNANNSQNIVISNGLNGTQVIAPSANTTIVLRMEDGMPQIILETPNRTGDECSFEPPACSTKNENDWNVTPPMVTYNDDSDGGLGELSTECSDDDVVDQECAEESYVLGQRPFELTFDPNWREETEESIAEMTPIPETSWRIEIDSENKSMVIDASPSRIPLRHQAPLSPFRPTRYSSRNENCTQIESYNESRDNF